MAGQKQHDFHIVDPSPWPFLAAVGAFLMLFGAVRWMHVETPYMFFIGLALVLYVMYAWWADVTREARAGDHTPVVQIGLRYGIILFIISEVMFFSAWFWNYFKNAIYPMPGGEAWEAGVLGGLGEDGVWPPVGVELVDPWHLPLFNTLLLLTSGAACTWAHHAVLENDKKNAVNGLLVAVVLGLLFTGVQAYEYYEIAHTGAFNFAGDIYGAAFFMATGFHGAHVIIGALFLIVCLIFALRKELTPQNHISFEGAAWYWHFVDVVWLFLFAAIYVVGYMAV